MYSEFPDRLCVFALGKYAVPLPNDCQRSLHFHADKVYGKLLMGTNESGGFQCVQGRLTALTSQ
jgi:hypothetical protein